MASSLRVVFAGTPEFAVPSLQRCLQLPGVNVAAAYTQPDRPAGRGRQLTASPVKRVALDAGIPVEQPATLRPTEVQEQLAGYHADLMVVVAYGLLLPPAVLDLPRLGCWNGHASLLPRWRGAAPIARAIAAGDTETGVCLMQMDAGLDTGPVLLRRATPIADTDTAGGLHDRLAELTAEIIAIGIGKVLAGQVLIPTPQAATGACYAHKLDKAEAVLDPARPAAVLARCIRAFNPWPVARLAVAGNDLRIWQAGAVDSTVDAVPGTVVNASHAGIDIACGEGVLRLLEVQQAGGRRIAARDYLNGHPELRRASPAARP